MRRLNWKLRHPVCLEDCKDAKQEKHIIRVRIYRTSEDWYSHKLFIGISRRPGVARSFPRVTLSRPFACWGWFHIFYAYLHLYITICIFASGWNGDVQPMVQLVGFHSTIGFDLCRQNVKNHVSKVPGRRLTTCIGQPVDTAHRPATTLKVIVIVPGLKGVFFDRTFVCFTFFSSIFFQRKWPIKKEWHSGDDIMML